jgi:prepilin-type N-terminal cleavage/methylation domain-containing protein
MSHGFSLPELLVTMAITLVLVVISVPSVVHLSAKHHVLQDLTLIRLTVERYINLASITGKEYEVRIRPPTIEVTTLGHRLVYRSRQIRSTLGRALEEKRLVIYPSGALSPVTVELHNARTACSLIVSLRGRVRSTC